MQEDQTVTFQPMYDAYPRSWFTTLFVFYLLFVLVLFLVRAIQICIVLRKLKKLQSRPDGPLIKPDSLGSDCHLKTVSLKNFATLTFLLSLLDFTWSAADILIALRTQKSVNVAFTLARLGDALAPLSLGLIVCTLLYLGSVLSESALNRRLSAFRADAEPVPTRSELTT